MPCNFSTHRLMRSHAALFAVLLIAGIPAPAHAYTDPGAGTFLFQALYATILVGGFQARRFIARLFGRRKQDGSGTKA